MKKVSVGAVVALAFSFCVVALAVGQGVRLVWKPKAGDTQKYRLNVSMTGDPAVLGFGKLELSITTTEKIKEVKEDGKVVQESTQSEFSVKVDGQDLGGGGEMPAVSVTTIFYPDGRIFAIEGDPTAGPPPRVAESMVFLYPGPEKEFRVGESWTHKRGGDAQRGTRASETTYTYLGQEKVDRWDAYKVAFKFRETEGENAMEVTGTVWLGVENGYVVKGEYELTNVEFAPGMPPTKASVKVTRIQ